MGALQSIWFGGVTRTMEEEHRATSEVRNGPPQPPYCMVLIYHWLLSSLTEISAAVEKQASKRGRRSILRNFSSYMLDRGRIDGMKNKLDTALRQFEVCRFIVHEVTCIC